MPLSTIDPSTATAGSLLVGLTLIAQSLKGVVPAVVLHLKEGRAARNAAAERPLKMLEVLMNSVREEAREDRRQMTDALDKSSVAIDEIKEVCHLLATEVREMGVEVKDVKVEVADMKRDLIQTAMFHTVKPNG